MVSIVLIVLVDPLILILQEILLQLVLTVMITVILLLGILKFMNGIISILIGSS